ncbi:MAG: 30S ribosome-binding factor RbfA [Pirellulales bacterium]|nr:30S ribosome-binding factor RbfA [Pirellulales bacterium]
MSSRRLQKAAEAFRAVISMSILTEVKDPRVRNVTVTGVEVAPDMRSAKVHVSVMGDETKQRLALRGLQNSAGFLQAKINERIETRYTPRLTFHLDQGVKNSANIARLLKEVLPDDTADEDLDAEDYADEELADEDSDVADLGDEAKEEIDEEER